MSYLERVLRRGEIDNLYSTMRKNQITIRGFVKLYSDICKVNRGIVTLRTAQPDEPPPAPPAAPPPETAPETAEERRARMDRQFEASQRLREEQDRAREQRQRERQQQRLGGVRAAFGVRPVG